MCVCVIVCVCVSLFFTILQAQYFYEMVYFSDNLTRWLNVFKFFLIRNMTFMTLNLLQGIWGNLEFVLKINLPQIRIVDKNNLILMCCRFTRANFFYRIPLFLFFINCAFEMLCGPSIIQLPNLIQRYQSTCCSNIGSKQHTFGK